MKKILFATVLLIGSHANAQVALKLFDKITMAYSGNKTEQAQLLLRKVKINGEIENKKPEIDSSFLDLINKKMELTKDQLKMYLVKNNISQKNIGGNIDDNISFIMLNGEKLYARYFVIHDMSSPEFQYNFPANINNSTWKYNNANSWSWEKDKEPAHILVTRTGQSRTIYDFSIPWRATKFESNKDNYELGLGDIAKGLFVHTELLQPRVYPPGKKDAAAKAPTPGFTNKQYEKLALLFICASVRKGDWLTPAFHACIDQEMKVLDEILLKKKIIKWIEDNHDDPQNFELKKFTDEILQLVSQININ